MTPRHWLIFSFIAALLVAGAILIVAQKNYVFRFTEPQLQEKLSERLPLTKSYFFIFGVTLHKPRVDLVEGSDRVAAGVDIVLNIKIGGSAAPLDAQSMLPAV